MGSENDRRTKPPHITKYATAASIRMCLIGVIAHLSLFVWQASNHPRVDAGVHSFAAAIRSFANESLPSRPVIPRDFSANDIQTIQNRYAPTWPHKDRSLHIVDIIGTTVYVPFELNVRQLNTTTYMESHLPALLFTLPATGLLAVIVWARHFRHQSSERHAVERLSAGAITLLLLLPVPFIASVFLRLYDAIGMGAPRVILTYAAVSTPTLILLATLLCLLYPLVFLHLRWKQAARLATRSPNSPLCLKCNYERGALDTCPECGTPRTAPTTKLSKAKRRTLIAGYAAIPLLLIAPFWISWIDIAIYHITH